MKILLENRTMLTFDLCKASPLCIKLFPGDTQELPLTARGWMHGHSEDGSFVIQKKDNEVTFKAWGKVVLEMNQSDDEAHIKVMMEY